MKYKNSKFCFFTLGIIVFICLLIVLLVVVNINHIDNFNTKNGYPEIKQLSEKHLDFEDMKLYFRQLAKNKGAVYAYEVLKNACTNLNNFCLANSLWFYLNKLVLITSLTFLLLF